MPTLEILKETEFDFTWIGANGDQTLKLVRPINVVPYRTGLLVARIHASDMTGTQLFEVKIASEAPTPDDPTKEFMGSDLASALFDPSDAAPIIKYATLTTPLPAFVRLCLRTRQDTSSGSTFLATASVALVLRERA